MSFHVEGRVEMTSNVTACVKYIPRLNHWFIMGLNDKRGSLRVNKEEKRALLEAGVEHIKEHSKQRLKFLFIIDDKLSV